MSSSSSMVDSKPDRQRLNGSWTDGVVHAQIPLKSTINTHKFVLIEAADTKDDAEHKQEPFTQQQLEQLKASATTLVQGLNTGNKSGRSSSEGIKTGKMDKVFNLTMGIPNMTMKSGREDIYTYYQMEANDSFFTSSTSAVVNATFYGQLADVTQYANFTALYDQYRIAEMEFWVFPRENTATGSSTNTGRLYSVIDYDNSTTLGTVGAATQYQNCLVSTGLQGHYRKWVPHVAVASYGGSFNQYANVKAPWIDCASTGVQHYAFKCIITTTDAAYVWDSMVRYKLQFRNVL